LKYTEQQLARMASPIGKTEEEKCKNAIRMVRDAMKKLDYTDDGKDIYKFADDTYAYALNLRQRNSEKNVTILIQGSYANKTNIPEESDVDVAIILESTFTTKYRKGVTRENYGFTKGTFSILELKDEVEKALNEHFGRQGVERHDKSIKVIGNTYRVDADVVPAYRYRDYSNDWGFNSNNYSGGIEIRPDSGGCIVNYPEQHIKNGILKNKETKYNYKKCVRIAKSMRKELEKYGFEVSEEVSSFGIESLLWNVRNDAYIKYSSILGFVFDEILLFLLNDFDNFSTYKEANGIKPLFNNEKTKQAYKDFIFTLQNFFRYDISGE
jgi:Nucleotidyltransferase domain.